MSTPLTERRDVNKTIAANVRAEFARAGLTHRKVARMLGLNEMWVSRRLNGKTSWDAQDVQLMADFLRVDPGFLFMSVRGGGRGVEEEWKLPEVDSNHQPAGSQSAPENNETNTGLVPPKPIRIATRARRTPRPTDRPEGSVLAFQRRQTPNVENREPASITPLRPRG
jgi:transcriptional regulator with XRE-family HTH domain